MIFVEMPDFPLKISCSYICKFNIFNKLDRVAYSSPLKYEIFHALFLIMSNLTLFPIFEAKNEKEAFNLFKHTVLYSV